MVYTPPCPHQYIGACDGCTADRERRRAQMEDDTKQEQWERKQLEHAGAAVEALTADLDLQDAERREAELPQQLQREARERRAAAEDRLRQQIRRGARWKAPLRILAGLATLDLLTQPWVNGTLLGMSFVGGAILVAARATITPGNDALRPGAISRRRRAELVAATGADLLPDERGDAWPLWWIPSQIPAFGLTAAAVAPAVHNGGSTLGVLGTCLSLGSVILLTGFLRVPWEHPFGRGSGDWEEVVDSTCTPEAGHDARNRTGAAESETDRRRRASGDRQLGLRDAEAAAGAAPAAHAVLRTAQEAENARRRKIADERARLLNDARAVVWKERQERAVPLLEAIAAQLPGEYRWGQIGDWEDTDWYDVLPASGGPFDGRLKEFLKDGTDPNENTIHTGHLADGPHPAIELLDNGAGGLFLVANRGRCVYLWQYCPACGGPITACVRITDLESIDRAAKGASPHRCPAAAAVR